MTHDYHGLLRAPRAAVKRSGMVLIVIGLALWLAIELLEPSPEVLQVVTSPDKRWIARLEIQRYSRERSYVVRLKNSWRWRTVFYSRSLGTNAELRGTAKLQLLNSGERLALVSENAMLWEFDIPTYRALVPQSPFDAEVVPSTIP